MNLKIATWYTYWRGRTGDVVMGSRENDPIEYPARGANKGADAGANAGANDCANAGANAGANAVFCETCAQFLLTKRKHFCNHFPPLKDLAVDTPARTPCKDPLRGPPKMDSGSALAEAFRDTCVHENTSHASKTCTLNT